MKHYSLILCAAIFAVFMLQLISGFTDLFILDSSKVISEPWRLFTSIFLHGSFYHLLSNLFALALFGSILEKQIGSNKLVVYFLLTGIAANIIASLFYNMSLGASGAIFGLLGVLALLKPKMIVWVIGIPMPMFVAVIVWLLLDTAGVFYPTNIANMAHIAGLLSGIIIGFIIRKPELKTKNTKPLSENEIDDWENKWFINS